MARPSARRVLPGTATLVTLLLLDGACRTAAAEVVEKVASSLNLPPPPPPAPSPPPALEVSPEALDAAPIRDTLTIIDENKQSSLSPLTPHEKLVEHAIEVETDPIRSTLSHSEVLKDIVERDRRPPWLSNVLQGFGLRVWVDESLCYMLNWACPEPPKFIDSEFGQVYFWALVSANIFVVLLLVSVLGGWLAHVCDPMPRVYRERREQLKQRPLTVLLPCYLPNECEIMDDTIEHMMLELEYDYPFTLIVCYNTPEPMEKEAELLTRDNTRYANGRLLRILKVHGSSSKAENLNAALEYVETENVVIYDADHHPDRESLTIATAAMEAHGVQCVQGSTYLRTRPNMLAAYINAEFFVTHFVFFPAMQVRHMPPSTPPHTPPCITHTPPHTPPSHPSTPS